MKKRILSVLLALVMCLSLLPTTAFADYATITPILDLLPTDLRRPVRPTTLEQLTDYITLNEDLLEFRYGSDEGYWPFSQSKEGAFQEIIDLTDSLTAGKSSDTEKMKAIYDWVSQNISYEDRNAMGGALGAYVMRATQCWGYADLCRLMGTLAGLTVAEIVGMSNADSGSGGGHAWNAVLLDGKWLIFDATWKMWDIDQNYHHWWRAYIYDDIYEWSINPGNNKNPDRLVFTLRRGFADQCPASVTIPDTVTEVTNFYGCPNLERITFSGTVTSVSACSQNPRLKDVSLPDGLIEIGNSAFAGCAALKSITIPGSVTTIDHSAFSSTGLTSVTIPGSVTQWGPFAFQGCADLKSVTLSNGVPCAADSVFMECTALESVTIPSTVTTIGRQAFYGCTALESITIPEGVTTVDDMAFFGCTNLKWADLPDSLTSRGVGVFTGCPNLKSVRIPKGLTSIGVGAFQDRTDLTGIIIPDNIIEISTQAFYGCANLTSVTIPEGVTTIGNSAFRGCTALESITIPSSVTTIEYGAFAGCASLKSVVIPPSVTSIGDSAFANCKALADVTISEGVTEFGSDAFGGTPWWTNWLNSQGEFSIVNGVLFKYQGAGGAVTIPSGISGIGGGAFSFSDVTSVTIPSSVTSIGEGAFSYCGKLTGVTIPNSVTSIEDRAFLNCTALTGVTIPDSVTTLGGNVFEGCTALENVSIGKGVTSIGHRAFSSCESLKSVVIPNGVTSIGNSAFSYCKNLASVFIPASVTGIDDYTFSNCTALTGVTIGSGVTSIGNRAFSGCENLKSVVIPAGVTSIGDYAFCGCTALTSVTIPAGVISIKYAAFSDTGLREVWYTGTEAQWKAIRIVDKNELLASLVHYNSPMPEIPAENPGFSDVPAGAYYEDAVKWAVEKKITTGTSATTFSPDATCTTAQILTFLWRANGSPEPAPGGTFSDVSSGDYYYKAALWAKEKGLTSGDAFGGNTPCTRSATVTYLWRLAGSPAASGGGFTDVPGGADCAQAVAWAVEKGITSGTSATTFSPDSTCTRGQIVTFLHRAYRQG